MLTALCGLVLATQSPGLVLHGRVVGPEGQPVAAEVVVGCQTLIPFATPEPFVAIAEATAAADGSFALTLPSEWIERTAGYRELEVFAYLAGYGIAAKHWSVEELPVGFEVELRLPAAETSRFRFVDPSGKPVAGARVWPQGLSQAGVGELRMPVAWWRQRAAITDDDGLATLPVARSDLERIGFEADGYGVQDLALDWESKQSWPSELEVLPRVERVLHFESPVPIGAVVEIVDYKIHQLEDGTKYATLAQWRGRVEGDSLTVLAGEGHIQAKLTTADASSLSAGFFVPDSSGELRINHKETFRVRGRTVSVADGTPVGSVRLFVSSFHNGWVESDADGRFEFDCALTAFSLSALVPPPGFATVPFLDGHAVRSHSEGELDLGDVSVQPTWTARGVVLGADRAPVSGAWVVGRTSIVQGQQTMNVALSAVTDANGRFALAGAQSNMPLEVTARLGERTAEATIDMDSSPELVLSRALGARGVARSTDGTPAAGVTLEVWRASPPNLSGGEDRMSLGGRSAVTTAADGSFTTAGGLEADERYCLVWSGERVESGRSDWLTGAELDAGVELEMKGLESTRGTIRRADGTPLAGAEVRLRRGGATRVTDEHGAFELPGVPAAGDALVVMDPDGAPQVRWVVPGSEELEWRLLSRGDEQPLAPTPEHARARELELAFELLDKNYAEAVASKNESQILRAVQSLAWADPALVLERVEAGLFQTGWMRDFSLSYVADALLPESPTEALAVSMRLDRGMSRSLSMLEAAERLDAAAEREQLALIRAEARAVDPPEHRVVVLAHLADRMLDLGEREAALGVLAEGREVANALPTEDWPGYARSRFGEVLSRVDPAAGRALIDELASVEDRPRHLYNTAHELAASDPAAAEALMTELGSRGGSAWSPDRYAARIVHRMAPVDLERARKLAARYDRTGFADGMIALALADGNPAEARASLEQAFRRAEELSLQGTLQWNERPIATAAALLPVAERVDPARLRAFVARALAVRLQQPQGAFNGDDRAWNEEATLAFYVARWQPEVARGLLEPAVAATSQLRSGDARRDIEMVWAALAVVDPEWAARVARDLGGRARSQIGLVLALPPIQRTSYCQEQILNFWVVGKEDL